MDSSPFLIAVAPKAMHQVVKSTARVILISHEPYSLLIIVVVSTFYYDEVFLGSSTEWAYPIIRDIFKWSAWSDTTVRIAYCWVIDVTTWFAFVLFHD